METYLFALGRDPALSIAEIESYFTARNIQIKIVETGRHAIVLSTTILPTTIIKELGGTVTIGRVLSSEPRTDRIEYSLDQEPLYTGTKNKITYSLTGFETDLDSFLKDYLKNRFKNEHLKALLKKEDVLLLNVGADVVVEKSVDGTKELLRRQFNELK